jgi:hypothetical protein
MSQLKEFGTNLVDTVNDVLGGIGDNYKANIGIEEAKAVVILSNAEIAQKQAQLVKENAEANRKLLRQSVIGVFAVVMLVIILNFAKKYI